MSNHTVATHSYNTLQCRNINTSVSTAPIGFNVRPIFHPQKEKIIVRTKLNSLSSNLMIFTSGKYQHYPWPALQGIPGNVPGSIIRQQIILKSDHWSAESWSHNTIKQNTVPRRLTGRLNWRRALIPWAAGLWRPPAGIHAAVDPMQIRPRPSTALSRPPAVAVMSLWRRTSPHMLQRV